jgi:hypothetical protein
MAVKGHKKPLQEMNDQMTEKGGSLLYRFNRRSNAECDGFPVYVPGCHRDEPKLSLDIFGYPQKRADKL